LTKKETRGRLQLYETLADCVKSSNTLAVVVSINLLRTFLIDFIASGFTQCIGRFGNQTYTRTVVGISIVGSKSGVQRFR